MAAAVNVQVGMRKQETVIILHVLSHFRAMKE
jgi:hypothetical protein